MKFVECSNCIMYDTCSVNAGHCRSKPPVIILKHPTPDQEIVETRFPIVSGSKDWCMEGITPEGVLFSNLVKESKK